MKPVTQEADNPLGYQKESKLLINFAVPCIISMLVTALYNIVDQIFIGQGVGMLEMLLPTLHFLCLPHVQPLPCSLALAGHLIFLWSWELRRRSVPHGRQGMLWFLWQFSDLHYLFW